MRIPTWRYLLTVGGVAVLAVAGIGLVAGAAAPREPTAGLPAAESSREPEASRDPGDGTAGPVAKERLERARGWGARPWLRLARHIVHAEVTVTGRDGELIVLAFDHGTVQSVDGGTLTIAEAGGAAETVSIDDETIVYVGRKHGDLDDLKVGAEVFVQSRVDGSTLAKRILVLPEARS
jgi:uncharacterized protein DUF5666